MRKLLGLALLLLAAAARGQGNAPMQDAQNGMVLANGGSSAVTFDPTASQTQATVYSAPCGAAGAPVFQAFCDGMNVILGQATTPGTPQVNFNNLNLGTGKGIATIFEVPLTTGAIQGTSGVRLIPTSTDGRWEICKAACDGTGTIVFGGNASGNAGLTCNATNCSFATIGGFSYPTKITVSEATPVTDTGATVTLTEAAGATTANNYHTCNATSNTVAYTLPAASASGHWFTIKRSDATANLCTIAVTSSDKIDGLANISSIAVTLAHAGDWVTLWDSTNGISAEAWQIVNGNVTGQPTLATSGAVSCSQNTLTSQGGSYRTCMVRDSTASFTGASMATATNVIPAAAIVDHIDVRNVVAVAGASVTGYTVKLTSNSTAVAFNLIGTATTSVPLTLNGTSTLVPANHADQYTSGATTVTYTPVGGASFSSGTVEIYTWFRLPVAPVQ